MFILLACEKPEKIDEYPIHKSKLVVNCLFSTDTNFVFKLSKSLSPLDNAPFPEFNSTNAYVLVFENDILFDSAIYSIQDRAYVGNANKKPTEGKSYKIEAYYPGFEKVFGQDQMPNKFELSNLTVNQSIITMDYQIQTNTSFVIKPETPNSQYLIIQLNVTNTNDTFNRFNFYNFNLTETSARYNSEFIANSLFISSSDGPITDLRINWEGVTWGDSIDKIKPKYDFIIESCSKNSFEYNRRLNLQIMNQYDPFSEPTPIHNNIVNGFGIFGGVNTTTFSYP